MESYAKQIRCESNERTVSLHLFFRLSFSEIAITASMKTGFPLASRSGDVPVVGSVRGALAATLRASMRGFE